MLLATTSSCRSKVTCRESPTRIAFSIGGSPLYAIREPTPSQARSSSDLANRALPSRAVRSKHQRKPCQVRNFRFHNELGNCAGDGRVGRKVWLTMFARQVFPSRATKESFR